jgi:hypothetical protein
MVDTLVFIDKDHVMISELTRTNPSSPTHVRGRVSTNGVLGTEYSLAGLE